MKALFFAAGLVIAPLLVSGSIAQSQTQAQTDDETGLIGPPELHALPSTTPTLVQAYGPAPQQFGQLRLPSGAGPFPVVIVIHGGCWTKGYETADGLAPLASALTADGYATWNIEYRQVGDPGGGWPGEFQDWGAATDYLRELARTQPLDLSRVTVLGHSAGAHAALWLTIRHNLPADSEIRGADPLPIQAAVAIDGPGDLRTLYGADTEICGKPILTPLFGGTPAEQPERYRQTNPIEWLPSGVPTVLIASSVLTPEAADAYQATASDKGEAVSVVQLEHAGHFNMLAPDQPSWKQVEGPVLALTPPR